VLAKDVFERLDDLAGLGLTYRNLGDPVWNSLACTTRVAKLNSPPSSKQPLVRFTRNSAGNLHGTI
jgi:hypothetical protein